MKERQGVEPESDDLFNALQLLNSVRRGELQPQDGLNLGPFEVERGAVEAARRLVDAHLKKTAGTDGDAQAGAEQELWEDFRDRNELLEFKVGENYEKKFRWHFRS